MKAGFGKAIITPPIGFSLVGYFTDRRCKGIRNNLYSIASVFSNDKEIFAIVSCDLIWIDKKISEKVKEIVQKKFKIPISNILLHATHTHTGPLPSLPSNSIYTKGFYVEKSYLEILPFYIAGSIKIAYENMEEVNIGFGKEEVEEISFNRRYLMKDGRVITNPFNQKEQIVKSAGPIDNSLGIMKITDKKGELKGILINFACHPDTLGDDLISTDWPGFLREKLEKIFPGTTAITLNGPSGDINHVNPFNFKTRTPDIGNKIAEKIKEKVLKSIPKIKLEKTLHIGSFSKKIKLQYREITKDELKKAISYLKGKKVPKDSLKYLVSATLVNIYNERKKNKNIITEITCFSFGNKLSIIGLPGEIFAEIGIKIKKNSNFQNTWIVQNCYDSIGYIPSKLAFSQHKKNLKIKPDFDEICLTEAIGINCSYETTLGSKVNEKSEEIIEKEVKKLLNL